MPHAYEPTSVDPRTPALPDAPAAEQHSSLWSFERGFLYLAFLVQLVLSVSLLSVYLLDDGPATRGAAGEVHGLRDLFGIVNAGLTAASTTQMLPSIVIALAVVIAGSLVAYAVLTGFVMVAQADLSRKQSEVAVLAGLDLEWSGEFRKQIGIPAEHLYRPTEVPLSALRGSGGQN